MKTFYSGYPSDSKDMRLRKFPLACFVDSVPGKSKYCQLPRLNP